MTMFSVFSAMANEAKFEYKRTQYSLTEAKKEIKRLWAAGFSDASGSKTRVWSNGDWENCGEIKMTGSNKVFIANTRMTKANY